MLHGHAVPNVSFVPLNSLVSISVHHCTRATQPVCAGILHPHIIPETHSTMSSHHCGNTRGAGARAMLLIVQLDLIPPTPSDSKIPVSNCASRELRAVAQVRLTHL